MFVKLRFIGRQGSCCQGKQDEPLDRFVVDLLGRISTEAVKRVMFSTFKPFGGFDALSQAKTATLRQPHRRMSSN